MIRTLTALAAVNLKPIGLLWWVTAPHGNCQRAPRQVLHFFVPLLEPVSAALEVAPIQLLARADFDRGLTGRCLHSDLIDRPGPVFEATEIVDVVVTQFLEQLASESRSPARDAIQNDRFSPFEVFIVILGFRVGTEFQHAAWHVYGAGDLAACGDLRRVTNIKD